MRDELKVMKVGEREREREERREKERERERFCEKREKIV